MEKKDYDPKLREAVLEFETLCKKYDCIGSVLFVSPTHSEFKYHLVSSWSVIAFEGNDRIRFRSKLEDFGGDKARQQFATESSAHALTSISEWGRTTHLNFKAVLEQLSKVMRILWKSWDHPDSVPGDGK